MNYLIYYKKLLQLIETLQDKEVYPKEYTNEKLKHELANLYMGWYLLGLGIDKEDKKLLIVQLLPTFVTFIVQSIFYDVINHYNQEIKLLIDTVDDFFEMLPIFNEEINNFLEKVLKEKEINKEDRNKIVDMFNNFVKKVAEGEDLTLATTMANKLDKIFGREEKNKYSIDEWIDKMEQIPHDLWKKFAYNEKITFDTDYENLYKFISSFNEIRKDFSQIIDIIQRTIEPRESMSYYFDKPYYEGFYKYFLPLYNKFKTYLLHPTKDSFEKLMMQIDHIKDIQHHSDFFWESLEKDTMDFISNASINELLQYVTDPDIKKIYKKYYILINRY